jgi:hypothetical protein
MRLYSFLFFCLCCFLLTQPALTHSPDSIPCPLIEFSCPTYALPLQNPLHFTAQVLGPEEITLRGHKVRIYEKKKLNFNWQVSGADIIRGQGTSNIFVEPNNLQSGQSSDIVFNLEMRGFPPECVDKFSCSLRVNPGCVAPNKFDSYGDILFEDEKLRLDNLAAHVLGGGSDSIVYILAYAGRITCYFGEAELRANRAKKYLIDNHGINEDRIIAFNGGYRENLEVEMFLSSRKGCGPFPSPKLGVWSDRYEGSCIEKYKNRKEQIEP